MSEPSEEIFPIPGWDDYPITKSGKVWSHSRLIGGRWGKQKFQGRWLRPNLVAGYHTVALTKNRRAKTLLVHRLMMLTFFPGYPEVDHRDGNRINNQLSNLRGATKHQNMMNRTSIPGSSSRFVGVTWVKQKKCWQAMISIQKKSYRIGYFKCELEAATARESAELRFYGEFAPSLR